MGFLDKFKVTGQGDAALATRDDRDDDIALAEDLSGRSTRAYSAAMPIDGDAEGQTVRVAAPNSSADSIITEAAPTELPGDFGESRLAEETSVAAIGGLPLIGHLPPERQQRILSTMLVAGVVLLLAAAAWTVREAGRTSAQVGAVGQSLMQSQRLAKSMSQALVGAMPGFAQARDAKAALERNVNALAQGDAELGVPAVSAEAQLLLEPITDAVNRASKNAALVLDQEKVLTQVGTSLRTINRQSADLLEIAETVSSLKLQQDATPSELAATGQLVMLTQRIGKSANEFLTVEGVSPEAVFLLGKDLNTFRDIANGLLEGDNDLRLPAARDPQVRERLQALLKTFDETRTQASAILGNLQGLVAAREAELAVVNESEPMVRNLEALQAELSTGRPLGVNVVLFGFPALLALLGGMGWLVAYRQDQNSRMLVADRQRGEAERQEREAKRINDANQAAILRLMNELQSVAEGDLTQQATVTEDITGAIADSVNYTVEELRSLVSQVQNTAARVTETTQQVEATSTELLAASDEQLREIRETGESVLQMAGRINRVSAQAQESANVARQSLAAAEQGLSAVQETIGGMNAIREQIQETSKRIKRLGESSQEIGEITELISDITEQTNVLALNAAIQAASAGDAGRGFSVVAEEVQRLAERSADATRQIAALVKTIQTDTADAVAAMERSTQGVVEGAKLSDNAGAALGDIDRVSRTLAELIQQISAQARQEADSANVVASNIQHIFAVTEQTGDGTRSTAQLVRELSRSAEELRQSVARFKVS